MLNDTDIPDSPRRPRMDYLVDPLTGSPQSIALGLLHMLLFYGYHYNVTKRRCKAIATTFFLATFIGYNYILVGSESGQHVDGFPSIILLSLLGSVSIAALQYLDVSIYHKQLEAVFREQLGIRKRFPKLGRVAYIQNYFMNRMKIGPVVFDASFYGVLIWCLLIVAITATAAHFVHRRELEVLIIGSFSVLTVMVISMVIAIQAYRSSLRTLHPSSEPEG